MAFVHFLKPKNELESGGRTAAPVQEDALEPERTCPNCHKAIPESRLWANHLVCPCGHHFRMNARQHIGLVTDKGSFRELNRRMPVRFSVLENEQMPHIHLLPRKVRS